MLARIYGIFTVYLEDIVPIHLILMANTIQCISGSSKSIESVFDLKGSLHGRLTRVKYPKKITDTKDKQANNITDIKEKLPKDTKETKDKYTKNTTVLKDLNIRIKRGSKLVSTLLFLTTTFIVPQIQKGRQTSHPAYHEERY